MKNTINIPQLGQFQDNTRIQEPNIGTRAEEILRFLSEAQTEIRVIREKLFGESEGSAGSTQTPHIPCLEELLARVCSGTASLVGDLKTINGRI